MSRKEIYASLRAFAMLCVFASPSWADYTLDRWYKMGDDTSENASAGGDVGANSFGDTYDSAGTLGSGTLHDLTANGADGLPIYADISGNRPVAGNTNNNFAIQFDGVDDYLSGLNLNDPSVAAPGSTLTYETSDRGMQLWVSPSAVDGVKEMIIDDGDQHGFNIATNGLFQAEVRDDIHDTGVSALEAQSQWTHLMLVHDSVGQRGAISWVNGLAVASQGLNYDSSSVVNLLVGANAELDAGETADPAGLQTPGFFSGIVDDIELFVIDDGSSYGDFDYTEDNGYFTDVYLPTTAGYGFTLNSSTGHNSQQWVKGDINFDGAFDSADVDAFVAGWLSKNADLAGVGPQAGDYTTIALGDLDLDGDTDLGDWVMLREIGPAAGVAVPSLSQLNAVPEPMAGLLIAIGGVLLFGSRSRAGQA